WPGDDSELIRKVSALMENFAHNHPTVVDMAGAEAFARRDGEGRIFIPVSWDDVKRFADELSWYNRRIALSKVLVVLDGNPKPYRDYEWETAWEHRLEDAAKNYIERRTSARIGVSLGFGALA